MNFEDKDGATKVYIPAETAVWNVTPLKHMTLWTSLELENNVWAANWLNY